MQEAMARWNRTVLSWIFNLSFSSNIFLSEEFRGHFPDTTGRTVCLEGLSIFASHEIEQVRIILTFTHDVPGDRGIDFALGRGMAEFITNEHKRIYGERNIGGLDSEVDSKCGLAFFLEKGEEFDDAAMLVAKQLLTILGVNDGERTLADFIMRQDTWMYYQNRWISLKEYLTRKYGLPKFSAEKEKEVGIFEEGILW